MRQGGKEGGGQEIDKEIQHSSVWGKLLRGQYGKD